MKKKMKKAALNILLGLLGVITVIPFVWMFFSSFKSNSEIMALDQTLLPQQFTLANYVSIQDTFNFVRFFGNSLFIALTISVIVLYTSALAGFVLSKYQFRGRNFIFGFVISTMMIPWAVTIIPKYEMFVRAGLQDTYASLVLPAMVSGFGIFMMRQNMASIPDQIIEAARVDGANDFLIFHKIIIPMSTNAISALAIFQFLGVWEDYLWPYLMINSQDKQLLPVGLNMFSGQYATNYGGLFAATTLSIVPVVIVYIIFQKKFIEGVASAAVKG